MPPGRWLYFEAGAPTYRGFKRPRDTLKQLGKRFECRLRLRGPQREKWLTIRMRVPPFADRDAFAEDREHHVAPQRLDANDEFSAQRFRICVDRPREPIVRHLESLGEIRTPVDSAAISLFAASGLTLHETATVMGQKDPQVTWRHYARLFNPTQVNDRIRQAQASIKL
jgi:hypothetical protein